MRVKIGNGNWIDDKDERICLQLTRKEIENISDMHPLSTLYASIPGKPEDVKETRDWMYSGTETIPGDIELSSDINKMTDHIYDWTKATQTELRMGDIIRLTECHEYPDLVGKIYIVENVDLYLDLDTLVVVCKSINLFIVENETSKSFMVHNPSKENFKFKKLTVTWDPNQKF